MVAAKLTTFAAVRQVVLLSLTASLNPTLLAVTTVMLFLDRPARLMAGYLLGAYTVSITLGVLIVFSLSDSSVTKTTQHALSPAADIVLGGLALAVAFALHSGRNEWLAERRRARKEANRDKAPPRWQRELTKGSPWMTFVIGVMLTLPGASYLAGLVSIHRLDYSTSATVLLIVGFNVVMLWLIEVPLVCWLIAPDWTPQVIARAKSWLGMHGIVVAARALAVIGALLVLKGVIGLLV
jgi:hypothetical protein